RRYLSNIRWVRAQLLTRLKRPREAEEDWRRVVALGQGQSLAQLRINRAYALARLGEYRASLAELEEIGQDLVLPDCLRAAGTAAQCMTAVSQDAALDAAERDRLVESCAARALARLNAGRSAGLFQNPRQAAGWLKYEPDWKPLRSRDDFKKLVAELE